MIDLEMMRSCLRWMRQYKFDRRWLAVGLVLIITGILFLSKGPWGWFMEWLDEGRSVKDEQGTKVWDI